MGELYKNSCVVVVNVEISYRDQNCFVVAGCKLVYFYCMVGYFTMWVYRNGLTFVSSQKWPLEKQHISMLASFFSLGGCCCSTPMKTNR